MAPAQNDLGIEFEALHGPVIVTTRKPEALGKSLLQRLSQLWDHLRRYG